MDKSYSSIEQEERKRGQHLGAEERGSIQQLKRLGFSNRAIAREMNCSPSTVGYERKRGTPQYAWLHGGDTQHTQKNQTLLRALVGLHEKYPALGFDSLHQMLKPKFHCSRGRIHRLMKAENIHSVRKRVYKATTNSRYSHPIAPNLLMRNFHFEQPNQAWVGDIIYVPTGEGWLCFAAVKDLCTRKIVGYAFSSRINTELTLAALNMAIGLRRPAAGLIFHSDRGVQYAATAYRDRLAACGIHPSMSRKGDPYDNAVAENFFSCLKCELVHLQCYATRYAAEASIFAYVEAFYNTVRPHSALGWLPPSTFERRLNAVCVA